jgi:hypothetical protein
MLSIQPRTIARRTAAGFLSPQILAPRSSCSLVSLCETLRSFALRSSEHNAPTARWLRASSKSAERHFFNVFPATAVAERNPSRQRDFFISVWP